MDRVDQIRAEALGLAVEARVDGELPTATVDRANIFHKFLLGGPQSLTKEEVVELEVSIRAEPDAPEERTYVGMTE